MSNSAIDQRHVHWDLTDTVIGAAIEVHRQLGPGLLEATYETCLAEELRFRGLRFERQVAMTLTYRETSIERAYQADLVIEGTILVELKAVDALLPVHVAQTLTYLKLLRLDLGLLVNFSAPRLTDGLRRITLGGQRRRSQ